MKEKINLKNSLNDDTLDLSMNDLQEVPVKRIAAIPKATTLDLSDNKLTTLEKTFPSSLTHLIKLDLSNNQLTSLPDNFGLLVHLKYLDLERNKLTTLPLSCRNLKALKWLDLKGNPLSPELAKASGPCLDAPQCQSAARSVIIFLCAQWKLEERKERELEEAKRLREEKEKAKSQAALQVKKKKKKSKSADNVKSSNGTEKPILESSSSESESNKQPDLKLQGKQNRKASFLSTIFKFLVFTIMLLLLIVFIISLLDEPTYHIIRVKFDQFLKSAMSKMPKSVMDSWQKTVAFTTKYGKQLKDNSLVVLHAGVIKVYNWYLVVTTGEKMQLYMETLKHYWHVSYIKITEVVTTLSNTVSSNVNN